MAWVKLDDSFPDHPKLACLGPVGPLCGWQFVAILSWCNRFLTNGKIPKAKAYGLVGWDHIGVETGGNELFSVGEDAGGQMLCEYLVSCGMLEEADKWTYEVHDYLDYQFSREEVEAKRGLSSKRSDAGRRGAAKRWQTVANAPDAPNTKNGQTMANAWQTDSPVPVPVPVPVGSLEPPLVPRSAWTPAMESMLVAWHEATTFPITIADEEAASRIEVTAAKLDWAKTVAYVSGEGNRLRLEGRRTSLAYCEPAIGRQATDAVDSQQPSGHTGRMKRADYERLIPKKEAS